MDEPREIERPFSTFNVMSVAQMRKFYYNLRMPMCLLQFWFVVVMSTIMENKDQKINAPKMPSVPFKYLVLAISHEFTS